MPKKKIQKWKNCLKQKSKTNRWFSLCNTGVWGARIKQNDNDGKFQSYKGTNLGYDMLCESVNSDKEEK